MDYYFVINEKTQSIEGYSKKQSTAALIMGRKKEQKPGVEFTLRRATFGEPLQTA